MSVEVQSRLEAFQATLPFELDPFQVEAIVKLGTHKGVLVSAPTSSGKTVVADYAIYEAVEDGVKAIYTTPLKALSNQKFRDLKKRYGDAYVGLVTGEHTINEQAPVVVMTTEILRNLIYDDPQRLKDVRYVVLDEVHYIDDYPPGADWEEVMSRGPPPAHDLDHPAGCGVDGIAPGGDGGGGGLQAPHRAAPVAGDPQPDLPPLR